MTARVFAALTIVAVAVGCGGDGNGGGDAGSGLEATLAYFPERTSALAVVSTDLSSESFEELDDIVQRRFGRSAESYVRETVEDADLSWADVEPLLGNELVVGVVDVPDFTGVIVAFRVSDGDRLRELLGGSDRFTRTGETSGATLYRDENFDEVFAVEGDILVAAADDRTLRETLKRADGNDRMSPDAFGAAVADLPEDALVRFYGNADRLLEVEEASPLRALPWITALRSIGAALSFREGDAIVDFALNTDPDRIDEDDLPLATGSDPPEVLRRDGEIVGGNRNQSLTTAFLFRAAEVAFPDSRFIQDVHEFERELGIDFVQEVLRQFDGPSASAVSVDGQTFAARSKVSDPETLKELLPRLAPHLPRLVGGLEALQSEGQALLFLLAPDVLVLRTDRVRVERVDNELWRVSGLTGEGPDQLYFGVLDDLFVVASDPELARKVASEDTEGVDGARGAGVLRVDLRGQTEEARDRIGADVGPVGEVVAWLEASEERLRGQVKIELE